MMEIFRGLSFVLIYIDDIVIFSGNQRDHLGHIRIVLDRLNKWNLRLQISKCQFFCTELIILGYRVSEYGIQVAKEKLLAIQNWPTPTSGKHLQQQLGFFNYFRKLVPLFSTLFGPLEKLRNEKDITWTQEYQEIYKAAINLLSSDLVLAFPNFEQKFVVGTDASDHGISAILYQEYDGRTYYIKFASRALQGAEATSYGATKRELLAIVFALKEFRAYLWGRSFILRTDHKALTYLFTQKYPNQMMQAWFELLLDFDFEIQYIPGIKNILPDRLSRLYDLGLRKDRYVFKNVRQIQEGDVEKTLQMELQSDTLVNVDDRDKRKWLLQMAHLKGHFGAKAIQLAIQNDGLTWPNIRADAQNCVSSCLPCQRYNIGKHGFHPLKNLKASLPFDHICIDVKNMVESSQGHMCYLLVIDVFTRFIFLKALRDQTAISVARALLEIFATVGFPRIVGSDNGSEFVNETMQELCRVSMIDHRLISAYHHRANGLAERAIRSTSDTIYKMLEGQMDKWDQYLLATQRFHNLKESELTGSTPYSLVFARKANDFEDYSNVLENPLSLMHLRRRLNYMNELVYPSVVQKSAEVNRARNAYFKKRNHIILDQFAPGAIVMVKDETRNDKNSPRYEGPFTVVRRNQGGAYVLRNNLDEELVRPPNVLKLVHHDLRVSGLPGIAAEVDRILDHKEVEGETHYLVHWKKLSSTLDQWVPHSEFLDIGPILLYHKCLKDGRDIHKDVSRRKTRHRNEKRKSNYGQETSVQKRNCIVENNVEGNSEQILSEQPFIPEGLRFEAPGQAMIKKSGSGRRIRPHVPGRFKE
jgi:transposase InsO family protein